MGCLRRGLRPRNPLDRLFARFARSQPASTALCSLAPRAPRHSSGLGSLRSPRPSSALVALVTSLEWGPFCCHNAGLTRQKIVLAPLHHFGQLPKKNFQKIFFRPCKSRRAQSIRAPMVPFEAEMLASTILSSSRVPSSKPKKKL